ncbi:hypothetical protein C2E21_1401 [Chlorella sorokiniana]|uniref:Uncharacterized protein n=1 Tax=Chlorella sorokiniana TaxID=3076 RepID=A0A2P6U149_CHLSO|nr:hypothetical protein C2E21_1401 [Chlorella sorokiniana]|eukprot:PRW60046.1 hypothetical protein C2E21_1401 [Chlorella sorokiniana]
MEALRALRPALNSSIIAAASWFHNATASSKRLHYAFHPESGRWEDRPCPIRDMGTAADLAVLQRHLADRRQFDEVIESTVQHYTGLLVQRGEGTSHPFCYLAAGRRGLGEGSSVAHSAMLLLGLAAWEGHPQQTERRRLMAQLAQGIVQQQRKDGSLQASAWGGVYAAPHCTRQLIAIPNLPPFRQIYFEPENHFDSGWQLYGGEAAYALAVAYGQLGDGRLLDAASHALWAYREMYQRDRVDQEELVFFANWQLQAAAAVHRHAAGDPDLRRGLAAYLRELQNDVIESRFFADVAAAPERQATVEVACALEGLVHCLQASLAQAASEQMGSGGAAAAESERHQVYADCALVAVRFLLEAQVKAAPGVPGASVGGFGHTQRAKSGQRVDVTGHVVCAFIKLLEILDQQAEE